MAKTTDAAPVFHWQAAHGGAVLTGCEGAEGHLHIPGEAMGLPVMGIAARAFLNAAGLTGITLPEGLREIGPAAFHGCAGLRLIRLPDSVTSLGEAAFQGCVRLARARLGAGLAALPDRAFYLCAALTEIDVPAGVRRIGERAFAGCARLAGLDVPASVTRIDATSLPPHLYRDGGLYLPRQGLLVRALASLRYRAPEGTRVIGDGALEGNHDITEIHLPDTVAAVGRRAFADCRCLHWIGLPPSLARLGDEAFADCRALRGVDLPGALAALPDGLFENSGLQAVTLPGGVAAVGDRAFAGCASLRRIGLNPGLRRIGAGAFARCASLKTAVLPEGLASIGPGAFSGCGALETLVIPGGLPEGFESALSDLRRVTLIAPGLPPEAFPPLWRRRVCLGLARALAEGTPCRAEAVEACVAWIRAHSAILVTEAASNAPLLRLMLDRRCLTGADARRLVDLVSRQARPETMIELLNYLRAAEADVDAPLW